MTAVIVGGDYVKPIEKIIAGKGIRRIEHWNGRKKGDIRKTFPKSTGLVVLLCDYLNHCLAGKVREDAERLGLPVLYCRRSLGQFSEKLEDLIERITTESGAKCCGICTNKATRQ
jgi:hypothetical protein